MDLSGVLVHEYAKAPVEIRSPVRGSCERPVATQFLGSLMRLLSKLVLSYAAVATALTNVGFGGKRGSYKHFQELDLGLDCDSDRHGAVAIAFVLGAQNLAAIPGGAPNLALARLAGWEYWLRGDPNIVL